MTGDDGERPDFTSGVGWIDSHSWFQSVGVDLKGRHACGRACDDLEDFEDIEAEMMKRGTLQHNTIRWDWVAEQSAALLSTNSKDTRLLVYLLWAAPHCIRDEEPVALAACLTARFLTRYGKDAHPSGKARMTQMTRVVEALETITQKAAITGVGQEVKAIVTTAMDACGSILAEVAPDLGIRVAVLPSRFNETARADPDVPEPGETVEASPQAGVAQSRSVAAPKAPVSSSPRPENLRLDAQNERALKQSLSVVADFLLEIDIAHPLSYRLRRYATWFGIASTPAIKSGDRAVIPGVGENVAEPYRRAAERGQSDAEIVKKLERFCHLQPFWFEGQWLSYRLAKACGRSRAAEAVRSEAQDFAKAVPDLAKLKFTDGTAMMPPDVLDWLNAGGPADGASPSTEADDGGVLRTARDLAKQGDFSQAIGLLDTARPQGRGARPGILWEVQVLEALSDWGLKSHTALQAERIADSIETVPVPDWEPDLFDRLKRLRS